MLGEPPRTQFDLHFSVAGIPVRVHPLFWLVGLILGASGGDGMSILIWIGVLFVSILIHELGHALTMRYYGDSPRIVLYMMGGLAIPDSSPFGLPATRRKTPQQHVLISAAGPGAGFALAALVAAVVFAAGGAVHFDPSQGILPLRIELERGVPIYRSVFDFPNDAEWERELGQLDQEPAADGRLLQQPADELGPSDGTEIGQPGESLGQPAPVDPAPTEPVRNNRFYLYELIHDLLWINIFWGLVNLLPVYPLDGGQIAREVLLAQDPWDGLRKSLMLSIITGAAVAIGGFLVLQSLFVALLFGSLALFNWQVLQQISRGGGWGGGRPW